MKEVLLACRDECRLVFTDAGVVLITLLAVVIYSFFYPVPYSREVLHDVPVAVVDADGSAMSRTYAQMLDSHETIRVAAACASVKEADVLLRRGEVSGIIAIPEGLERDVLRGRRVRVPAFLDASYMLAYSQLLRGVLETTGTLSAGVELARWRAAGKSGDSAQRARQPVVAELRPLFSPASGYGTYAVPAVLVIVLQQTLLIGAGMVGGTRRERARRLGTAGMAVEQPGVLSPALQVVGRSVPYLGLYAANAAYYFGFVLWYQGFPVMAAAGPIALFTVPFLLATTMMALALRGLFFRRETAVQVLLCTSLPFVFAAGFSWPAEALPSWIQWAARLVPTTSAIPGYLRLARLGAGLADVRNEAIRLWMLALLYFPFACWAELYSRRERPDVHTRPDRS